MQNNLAKARMVSRALENSGYYTLLSNIHRPKVQSSGEGAVSTISNAAGQLEGLIKGASGHKTDFDESDAEFYYEGLPVVSFRFSDKFKADHPGIKQAWIQAQIRAFGWIVPK
jgi:glutamate decarboxylase